MASNTSKIQHPNKKQFMITLPQTLVKAKGWDKGDKIEFLLDDKGQIILKKKRECP
jgi:bifunctional DNA-binding transcriptional regulator/antitoxin component of YhaV-PrlF toxin-antitoxin module